MRPTSGALTDEEGRFHIEDLAPGPETLTATHPDHPPATLSSIEIPPGGEVTDLEILLLPAGGVEGFVYDASGAPQVGTFLGAGGSLFDIRRTTVTDEEGHYEIRGLAEGPCTVMKGSLGDAFLDGLASQTTDIRAGEMSRLDFGESKSGCRLHGRVLAREGPVPGATLTVTAEGSGGLPFLRSTTSGSAGTYSMEGIPPGKATLQVRTGGSGPAQGYVLSLEVPDEESFSLDVTLPEGGFSGTVRDADSGRPLSGIQIQVAVPEKERSSSLAGMAQRDLGRGVTDEQGKYAIVGLFPGTYDCTANGGETYGRLTVQGVQVPDGRMLDGVDFRLRTSGAIRGRATGPDGSPVARAYLHLRDSRGVELSGFTAFTAFTGEDGRFTVRNLAPDTYRVTALTRSLAPASREVEVWSDTESACELSLVEGGSLDLQVVGRAGNALSGAQADLLGSDGKSILVDRRLLFLFAGGSDRTGEDGTLLVEHVPAGHYTLVLEREGEKARERVEIQDGQTTTLRVRLDT
jgi:protocatechuate 3,4-dioxygenase beta subunit